MKRNLNLLPWKLRCRMLLRQRLKQWTMIWSAFAITAIGLYGWNWHSLSTARQELDLWQRRAATVQIVDEKNAGLRAEIARLLERLAKYGHLESDQIGFQLLATISQSSSSLNGGKIQVHALAFKQTQVPDTTGEPQAPAGTPPNPEGTKKQKLKDVRTLSLSGVASSNLAVAQFVSSLRDSGAFLTVDLKSSQGNKISAVGTRNYQVECSF